MGICVVVLSRSIGWPVGVWVRGVEQLSRGDGDVGEVGDLEGGFLVGVLVLHFGFLGNLDS